MTDRAWYHVHPAIGFRPLGAGETLPHLIAEAQLPEPWVALDDYEQDAQEVAFFTRCIELAVGPHRGGRIQGHVLSVDSQELELDDPLDERIDLLFAIASPTAVQILADDQPVVRIGCDWGQAAALLTPSDTDQLDPWSPSAARLSTGQPLAGHDPHVIENHRRRHHRRDPNCPACPGRGDAVVTPSLLANHSDPYDPILVGEQGLVTSLDRAAGLLPLRIFDTDELIVDFGTGRWAQCGSNDVLKTAPVSSDHH